MTPAGIEKTAKDFLQGHVGMPALRAVESALDATEPRFINLWCGLHPRSLPDDEGTLRASCLWFQYAAIQLADDRADGDVPAARLAHAPSVQALLANAAFLAACRSQVRRSTLVLAFSELMAVGSEHMAELCVSTWDYRIACQLAEGLNARQYSAYFSLFLDGTDRSEVAATAGALFGSVLHVAGDRASGDVRWLRLPVDARRELLGWARMRLEALRALHIAELAEQLDWFEGVLDYPVRLDL